MSTSTTDEGARTMAQEQAREAATHDAQQLVATTSATPADVPTIPDDAPPAAVKGRRAPWWQVALNKAAPILAALGGIVGIWYLVSYVVLEESRRFLLPPPHQVFANTLGNAQVINPMIEALGQTVMVALSGLGIAVVIGMSWAIFMSQSRWFERILYPYAVILQTIPILALTPLIGIWMGYGFSARIVVCVIIAVFPMIANTLFGLQSATPAAHDLFTLNKASRLQRLTRLQLPAAIPAIFTGLRNAAGLSVIGAIVGDFFFQQGSPGIGGLLRTYTLRLNMDSLFLAIILTALFGVLVFSIFAALDRAVVGRLFGTTTR